MKGKTLHYIDKEIRLSKIFGIGNKSFIESSTVDTKNISIKPNEV